MEDITLQHDDVREEVRSYIKNLRNLAKAESQRDTNTFKEVIFTEVRRGSLGNNYVNRLVLFLRGTGCSLVTETGGCTFCGFYNATNFGIKISDKDYMTQISKVISNENLNLSEYPIICLYNDGSMLREEEISFANVINIIQLLSNQKEIKKIVIESRVADITEEKVRKLREMTDKEIEIAVGFESWNSIIRDICINKNFENSVFESRIKITKEHGINLVPLLMLKPPFLTEKEAIEDYLKSLAYLEQFNLKRIDMELPTVETHTLVYELWEKKMYRPAWLWSVIKILKLREENGYRTPIYISPMNYSVSAKAKAYNCPECDNLFYQAFEDFNRYGDVTIFDTIECSCEKDWVKELNSESSEGKLLERVRNTINVLTQLIEN